MKTVKVTTKVQKELKKYEWLVIEETNRVYIKDCFKTEAEAQEFVKQHIFGKNFSVVNKSEVSIVIG